MSKAIPTAPIEKIEPNRAAPTIKALALVKVIKSKEANPLTIKMSVDAFHNTYTVT